MRINAAALGIVALVSSSFLAAACGSAQPAPAAPASAGASASAPPVSVPAAWRDDLTKEQKAAFMKANVAPRMAKVFQTIDAKRHAAFDCKTCHGPKIGEPRDFLPKLAVKDGKLAAFAEKPEIAKAMAEKVVPEMAAILGKERFDPATKKGFGCMGCHAVEK